MTANILFYLVDIVIFENIFVIYAGIHFTTGPRWYLLFLRNKKILKQTEAMYMHQI